MIIIEQHCKIRFIYEGKEYTKDVVTKFHKISNGTLFRIVARKNTHYRELIYTFDHYNSDKYWNNEYRINLKHHYDKNF